MSVTSGVELYLIGASETPNSPFTTMSKLLNQKSPLTYLASIRVGVKFIKGNSKVI